MVNLLHDLATKEISVTSVLRYFGPTRNWFFQQLLAAVGPMYCKSDTHSILRKKYPTYCRLKNKFPKT